MTVLVTRSVDEAELASMKVWRPESGGTGEAARKPDPSGSVNVPAPLKTISVPDLITSLRVSVALNEDPKETDTPAKSEFVETAA